MVEKGQKSGKSKKSRKAEKDEKAGKTEITEKTEETMKTEKITRKSSRTKKKKSETEVKEPEKPEKPEKEEASVELVESGETEKTELEEQKTEIPRLDSEIRRLIKVRIRQKSRKPEFKRYESHKKLRLRDKSWRRPRGMDNKMRKRIAGKKPVSVGFGTPSAVRHLHPSGFKEVLVRNPSELDRVDVRSEAIRIASSVGLKKRLAIEDKAKEMGIRVLNPQR